MTRKELKEFLENSEFTYHSKIRGKKSNVRYTLPLSEYIMYLLCVDYNENSLDLYCQHYGYMYGVLHHSDTYFTDLHVHNLTKEQLQELLNMFTSV